MKLNTTKGITILETILFIGAMSALVWFVFTNVVASRAKTRDIERVNNIKYISTVLQKYFEDNKKYPPTLSDELLVPTYTKAIPKDPITGKDYLYAVISSNKTRRCLNYHLGAVLEDTPLDSDILKSDADFSAQSGLCPDSSGDFDGTDPVYDIKP